MQTIKFSIEVAQVPGKAKVQIEGEKIELMHTIATVLKNHDHVVGILVGSVLAFAIETNYPLVQRLNEAKVLHDIKVNRKN